MIICVCNALNEKSIKEACKGCNADCAENVMSAMGCSPVCGQCLCYIDEMVAQDRKISSVL